MHNKKAQSISMNTVIIAAIALLVLVIVSIIFLSGMLDFTRGKNDCSNVKGSCDYGKNCPDGWIEHSSAVCYEGEEVDRYNACCIRIS